MCADVTGIIPNAVSSDKKRIFLSKSAVWRMDNKQQYPVVVVILYCMSTMKASSQLNTGPEGPLLIYYTNGTIWNYHEMEQSGTIMK